MANVVRTVPVPTGKKEELLIWIRNNRSKKALKSYKQAKMKDGGLRNKDSSDRRNDEHRF